MSPSQAPLRREERYAPEEPRRNTRFSRLDVPWQARLLLLAAIWGMSFVFIKVGDEALAPLQVALGRTLCGAATLLVILAARREALPRNVTVWMHLVVVSLLGSAIPFSLFAYGETHTTSVLAGIWNGTTPLFTAPVALLMLRNERLTAQRGVGLVVGFVGVLVVLGVPQGLGGGETTGNLLCLGAALSYGVAFPYTRRFLAGGGESMVALATGQLVCATIELALVTPFLTGAPTTLPLKVVASVVVLGALGTGVAYILNYGLIRDAGATLASTVTYIVPLFSTVAGVTIMGERLTWYEPVGGLVVILGVVISQGWFRGEPARSSRTAEGPGLP